MDLDAGERGLLVHALFVYDQRLRAAQGRDDNEASAEDAAKILDQVAELVVRLGGDTSGEFFIRG